MYSLMMCDSYRMRSRSDRIARHQLRMREALVDVLVDDVRLVQDEVALDQDRHLVVRVHQRDVFGLGEQVDVADLEVHALLEEHEAAAVRIRVGGSGIEHHHGRDSQGIRKMRKAKRARRRLRL